LLTLIAFMTPNTPMKRTWLVSTALPLLLSALAAATGRGQSTSAPSATAFAPLAVPVPGPANDGPYAPQPILPGGIVVPLYAPDSPLLNHARVREAERYNMTDGVPGRIQSVVNIHNPSIEVHTVETKFNTGAAVILVAGGAHLTLNVGPEGGDAVPWLYNYGVTTIILRNRLKSDGYNPLTDEVNDALQAIRLVRAHAAEWKIDPAKIGILGFSAGAELAASTAVFYPAFDRSGNAPGDPLERASSRPDFVGLLYPGPSPFTRDPATRIPADAPPTFIACAGSGDRQHAIWSDTYFAAMLHAGVPNLEMHIYGDGVHADGLQDRSGIPFGTWPQRYIDWLRDLGFLGKPGVETKAARDVAGYANRTP
jgi:endo-1,4-beta-xylanase